MKKIILILKLFAVVTGILFFILMTYFHLSIENNSGKRVVVDRVVLGILPISREPVALEPRGNFYMSPLKFSVSPTLLVEMTDENGHKKKSSCVLDAGGSDSCHVYISNDGTLDCSECYH